MSPRDAYTERETRRLITMLEDGETAHAIARELHRSVTSVRTKAGKLRKRYPHLPKYNGRCLVLSLRLSSAVINTLRIQGDALGLRPVELASTIVSVVAKDDLFNAVLGDDQ